MLAWLAAAHAREWAFAFYALALIFNYPHFMATIYRAYRSREEFQKYRIFTLHLTVLLALTAILAHADFRLVPWIFTLYIDWSPWHYSGQNFGLLMMFARRNGAPVTSLERRLLQIAFIASYAMLLVSFHTGPSNDPLILSLSIPATISVVLRWIFAAAFLLLSCWVLAKWISRRGFASMAAPLTLLLSQFLWFLLPTILELVTHSSVPQTRYSSGILAVLHSAQYIWITSYYARKEARASGESAWRLPIYFVTLIAGGVGLFIAGPWLVSYTFHYDFTVSFLIFTALVNIHHFLLDGAIWKLRDNRIASFLVGTKGHDQSERRDELAGAKLTRWLGSRSAGAHAFRVGIAAILILLGGLDLVRYFAASDVTNPSRLARAASLNPYDSGLEMRIARADVAANKTDDALAALDRAIAANPTNPGPQEARARVLITKDRYQDAYDSYHQMLKRFPDNTDALINYGLLAARIGHSDEAESSWQKAVTVDPTQTNAHLYLAELFARSGKYQQAIPHFEAFLRGTQASADTASQNANANPNELASQKAAAGIQLGDAYAETNAQDKAAAAYRAASSDAGQAHQPRLQSLALAHLADTLEHSHDIAGAALAAQQSLAIDVQLGDSQAEAIDWFNYGKFLERHSQPAHLSYACYLRAEELLKDQKTTELEAVSKARTETERKLAVEAASIRKNLPAELAQARSLGASAFQ
jgi:tetratricopeptide (TPR) repeat protein